jgi:hypothetical protein
LPMSKVRPRGVSSREVLRAGVKQTPSSFPTTGVAPDGWFYLEGDLG